MNRKRRYGPDDFRPENQRKVAKMELNGAASIKDAQSSIPPQSATVEQKVGWAFTQQSPKIVINVIQFILEGGHLGVKFLEKAIKHDKQNFGECAELQKLSDILNILLPIRHNLEQFRQLDKPLLLVTPLSTCIKCDEDLLSYEAKFSNAFLFQPTNKIQVQLTRIRCKPCNLSYGPWCIDKGKRGPRGTKPTSTDDQTAAMRYYYPWSDVKWVEGNERNYFSTCFCEQFSSSLSHCWTSVQSFSEAVSEAMHILQLRDGKEVDSRGTAQLERRILSELFLEYEIWLDLLDQPKKQLSRILNTDDYLTSIIDKKGFQYDHIETQECIKYGCKWYSIADGNWKLKYGLCMFMMLHESPVPGITVPTNCHNQPVTGKAFCSEHAKVMEKKRWPTNLRKFIEKCQTSDNRKKALEDMQADEVVVNEIVAELEDEADESDSSDDCDDHGNADKSCMEGPITRSRKIEMEKVHETLEKNGQLVKDDSSKFGKLIRSVDFSKRAGDTDCSKNLGRKGKMAHYSRGHMFIVAPCGQILRSAPLYTSESPSQAFQIMMDHLLIALKEIEESDWHKYTMVYDNICHVDDMIALRKELPTQTPDGAELFPKPFNKAWLSINKAIDSLHISNHKTKRCQVQYRPEKILELHPEIKLNTMRAEQTFVWLSRFKKILCAMPKTHHLFMLDRIIIRRNNYTKWKLNSGSVPNLPQCRNAMTT